MHFVVMIIDKSVKCEVISCEVVKKSLENVGFNDAVEQFDLIELVI